VEYQISIIMLLYPGMGCMPREAMDDVQDVLVSQKARDGRERLAGAVNVQDVQMSLEAGVGRM
jgi:hypothetical protein